MPLVNSQRGLSYCSAAHLPLGQTGKQLQVDAMAATGKQFRFRSKQMLMKGDVETVQVKSPVCSFLAVFNVSLLAG